ncbi:MAG: PD-(D/E)XK nuclease family transposase [Bacteroidia bacterium]|nr:PD-(D/E)XK nuclease family transposase [Bacteroidia bacterium]
MIKEKYVNPFTDFGFKKLFGEEVNKDLLIDFLNSLLIGEQQIKNLTYLKNEHLSSSDTDRKAIFDLYCENERGEKFIVELQKAKQNFFKDRSVYYSTFPIQEQAKQGNWNFELKAVYTIGILDFMFDDQKHEPNKILHKIKLSDIEKNTVFYDKLTYIYLEMPKFTKKESELKTSFDKWLFVLRHLPALQNRPKALQERIFEKLFKTAEIAKFSQKEMKEYEDSLKYYRDFANTVDTAEHDGRKKEKIEIAKKCKKRGMSIEEIADLTGLSKEEITRLK